MHLEAGGGGGADPVQITEAPEVGEADQQDAEEEEHVDEGDEADLEERSGDAGLAGDLLRQGGGIPEGDSPGVEEGDLDIEDQEDQRHDVEAQIELDPTRS